MVTAIDVGRTMMLRAGDVEDDAEFNTWARVGPILINHGPTPYQTAMCMFTDSERFAIERAARIFMDELNSI
jgi:hypothetical protein